MDGTLYDSMPNHARAWYNTVTPLGIEATVDEFFLYEGRTGASTINLLFNREFHRDATDTEKKDIYHQKTVEFCKLPPVEVMPGAQDMVRCLRNSGVLPVLVTGSGQSSLISRLDADYDNAFATNLRVTSADVIHGKPHPEPYLMALKKAGVQPWQAIAVENAPLGVQSAVAAGVFTIAVVTGPIPAQAMTDSGATVIFESMQQMAEQLPALLDALNATKA
jgi:HAD superfamily hydrolase (TIGR01509 family)